MEKIYKTAIVMEDNKIKAVSIVRRLLRQGYQVTMAHDIEDFYREVRTRKFDLYVAGLLSLCEL